MGNQRGFFNLAGFAKVFLDERALIQTQLQQGFKPGAIAVSLNRPRSCITRELVRILANVNTDSGRT